MRMTVSDENAAPQRSTESKISQILGISRYEFRSKIWFVGKESCILTKELQTLEKSQHSTEEPCFLTKAITPKINK